MKSCDGETGRTIKNRRGEWAKDGQVPGKEEGMKVKATEGRMAGNNVEKLRFVLAISFQRVMKEE